MTQHTEPSVYQACEWRVRLLLRVLVLAMLIPAVQLCAATTVFTNGGGGGLWGTAANWSLGSVPGALDNAVINQGRVATIAAAAPAVDTITVGNTSSPGTALHIGADVEVNRLRVAWASGSIGAVIQSAGVVEANSGFEIAATQEGEGAGSYRIQGGSLLFPTVTWLLGTASPGDCTVALPPGGSIQGQALTVGNRGSLTFVLETLGVTPIELTSNLAIETGAQLVVDGTHYEALDGYFPLILSPAISGAFASENVHFIGLAGREPALVMQEDGLWLRLLAPETVAETLCSLTPPTTAETDYDNTVFSASRALSASGSAWSLSLHEAHVMEARLSQEVQDGGAGQAQRSWDLRVGRGGHAYSLRTPALGETVPPQWRSDGDSSPWNDEVWQGVAVDSAQNDPPDSPYFIHQSGVYTKKDPSLAEPFYSPQVAAWLDLENRSFTTVNWGQQAHIGIYTDESTENDWKSHMLFYTRYRDLGQGVIEVSLGIYNYGPDRLTWLNMPWGGVRRTSLEYAFLSNPGGTTWSAPASHNFGTGDPIELNDTGGWVGFSASNTGVSPALGVVFGQDSDPLPEAATGASWYRWGYAGGSFSPEETTWRNYFVSSNVRRHAVPQGDGIWSRYYFVLGGDLTELASRIADRGLVGEELRAFGYDEATSPLIGYELSDDGSGLCPVAEGAAPQFSLYAHPVGGSFPIYELLQADGSRRLSWDPYATGTIKTYDGSLPGIRLLGFALPLAATNRAGTSYPYARLTTLLADSADAYLPSGEDLAARTPPCENPEGAQQYYLDADGDGFGDATDSVVVCEAPPGYLLNGEDWDDTRAEVNPAPDGPLIVDDFDSGTVGTEFVRIRQSRIDAGWQANSNAQAGQGQPGSGWTVAGGVLSNPILTDDSAGEGAVAQVVSVDADGSELVLSFAYTNSGDDTLYVHLWGFVGEFAPDDDNIGNPQASGGAYHNLAEDVDGAGQVDTYNFKDGANPANGAAAHALVALSGSGRYFTRIHIADLGIPGVYRAADFSFISLAFTRNLGSTPGTTSIDQLQLSVIPDAPDAETHKRHYSYVYFEHGYPTRLKGRRPQSEANLTARANPDLVVQTGYYSLMLGCDDLELTGYNALNGSDYLTALNQDVTEFTAAQLLLRAYHDGVAYDCTSAVVQTTDQDNVRLVESGQFVQRIDHLGLVFTAANGDTLPETGRLELTAWPDRVTLLLDFGDSSGVTRTTIQVISPDGEEHLSDASTSYATLTVRPHEDDMLAPLVAEDYITTARNLQNNGDLSYHFDEQMHALHIDVPADPVVYPDAGSRVDEYLIEIRNPTAAACHVPLVFDQIVPRAITGTSMHLASATDSRPLGIPVQISKNWHRGAVSTPHEGRWLRGSTMLSLPAGTSSAFKLRVVYGYWGEAAAVSHAQLSLIGWGGNWKWDESALGAWGESMTYDPSQHLGSAFIDDVRPTFTTSMSGGTHNWTENVGGGDFLVYRDSANIFRWAKRLKTAYQWTGPNMTSVLYSGITDDEKIRFTYTTRMVRSNDYHRRFHRYRYEFLEDVTSPERLIFHQLAADYYTGPSFSRYFHGGLEGPPDELLAAPGGNTYNGDPLAFDETWLAIDDETAGDGQTAHGRRGILSFGATLNGAAFDTYLHPYGRSWGSPRMLFDLAGSSSQQSFTSGDIIEGELAFVLPAKTTADYWGADAAFAARLAAAGDSPWQSVADEYTFNRNLAITVEQGTLLSNYPLEAEVADDQSVLFDGTIGHGGIGHIPLILRGVPADVSVLLQREIPQGWVLSPESFWAQTCARADGKVDWIFNLARTETEPTEALRLRAIPQTVYQPGTPHPYDADANWSLSAAEFATAEAHWHAGALTDFELLWILRLHQAGSFTYQSDQTGYRQWHP